MENWERKNKSQDLAATQRTALLLNYFNALSLTPQPHIRPTLNLRTKHQLKSERPRQLTNIGKHGEHITLAGVTHLALG